MYVTLINTLVSPAEASKLVMSYVAAVCGKGAEVNQVKEQLLQSNPVLEGRLVCLHWGRAALSHGASFRVLTVLGCREVGRPWKKLRPRPVAQIKGVFGMLKAGKSLFIRRNIPITGLPPINYLDFALQQTN